MNLRTIGVAAALGSGAAWAVGALLFERITTTMSPLAMTLTKGCFSILWLAIALVIFESRGRKGGSAVNALKELDRRSIILLCISGFLGISIADTCFFAALSLLSAHSVVLLMMVGFILTPTLAMIFLREKSSFGRWLAIALVIVGTLGTTLVTGEAEGATRAKGIALGLTAVVSMSVSYVIAKRALESLTALQGTFIRMLVGTLGMAAYGLLAGCLGDWLAPLRDVRLAVYFACAVTVITFGGFWLTNVAIKNIDLTIANTLMATEPIFVLIIGVAFLGSRPEWTAYAGTLIAMVGIAILFKESATSAGAVTPEETVEA